MPSTYKESLHAEVNAINKAKRTGVMLHECDLFIVRIGQTSMNFPLKYSKPCERCANYIAENKIKKTFYSLNEVEDYDQNMSCQHM
jgi:deoxycytidylate deaminase